MAEQQQHVYDEQLDDDIRESSDSSSVDDEVANQIDLLKNRGKRKKKTGRRSMWPESTIDDLVDIVCSSSALTQKLVYENTKKTANTLILLSLMLVVVFSPIHTL